MVVVACGPVVVVVAAGTVVVVLPGAQGFGEQVPGPALIPFRAAQSMSPRRTQSVKAPVGDDCSQHCICGRVVVVVAVGTVVVVDGGGWQSHPMLGQPGGTGFSVQVLPAGH